MNKVYFYWTEGKVIVGALKIRCPFQNRME